MRKIIEIFGPGLLIAATGVGAGDLITASLAGTYLGPAILWVPLLGALVKWSLNEGIARWQMATDTTLLYGIKFHLGKWASYGFLLYLFIWSFMVGGALMSACAVAADSILPLPLSPKISKIIWGVIHSLAGVVIVWKGGLRAFEVAMSVCVGLMFFMVIGATFFLLETPESISWEGLLHSSIGQSPWFLGLLGGIGGTLTLISYGYWIRENKSKRNRQGMKGLRLCQLDLTGAYLLTALFSMAMIIVGTNMASSNIDKARLPLLMSQQFAVPLGALGKWGFLLGFWGAVFSSLLGVWQSVPYMFADFMSMQRLGQGQVPLDSTPLTHSKYYRLYLIVLGLIPIITLWANLEPVQLAYAVSGALFMPLLGLALFVLNNQVKLVGKEFKNSLGMNILLIITIGLFCWLAYLQIQKNITIS